MQRLPFWGLVSLADMLPYAADDFQAITSTLMQLSAYQGKLLNVGNNSIECGTKLRALRKHAEALGLQSTLDQLETIHRFIDAMPSDGASTESFSRMFIELQQRVWEDLRRRKFFCIPADKTSYIDPNWLVGSPIQANFNTAWKEFQRAGRCFAYGEGTACAFHLQRALEVGLKSLAVDLGQRFDRNSWDAHLKDIERELKNRYGTAGARTPKEKFYSEAATQFGHMKVAWRNPTMHIEAQYDDGEAEYLLVTIEKFMTHLATSGLKE